MDRKRDVRIELKVGITAGVALLLLAVIIFTVGKFHFGRNGYPIEVTFGFVDAINSQADVYIGGGVKIGRVDSVSVQGEKVVVRVLINNNIRIPIDAKIQILSKGLMGDKYLNVIPQTSTKEYLQPGARVEGVEPANIDKAFQRLGQVADSVRTLLGDPEMKSSLVDMLHNFSSLSGRLDQVVRKNEGRINQTFQNFADAAQQVSLFSHDLEVLSHGLNETLSPLNRQNLGDTLSNLKDTSVRLNKTTEKISQGKGALGVLVEDEQVGEDLKALIKKVKDDPWRLLWKQ